VYGGNSMRHLMWGRQTWNWGCSFLSSLLRYLWRWTPLAEIW